MTRDLRLATGDFQDYFFLPAFRFAGFDFFALFLAAFFAPFFAGFGAGFAFVAAFFLAGAAFRAALRAPPDDFRARAPPDGRPAGSVAPSPVSLSPAVAIGSPI